MRHEILDPTRLEVPMTAPCVPVQSPIERRHSVFGIASIVSGIMGGAIQFAAVIVRAEAGSEELASFFAISGHIVVLLGIVLGIVALVHRGKRKILGIVGIVVGLLAEVFAVLAMLILLGSNMRGFV